MSPGNHRHRTLAATPWRAAPEHWPALSSPGEVHLWCTPLAADPIMVAFNKSLLSPPELERAGRFHFVQDRAAFIVARGTLRRLLGRYLDLAPKSLSFGYGPYGKPFLFSKDRAGLNFNVSHAGGYALYGFTTGQPIGVDLEAEDPSLEIERLTKRFFSPTEIRQVLALPTADRVPAFFRTWTRKEAFLKANGAGLSLPLNQFSVTVDLQEPVRLERLDWAPGEVGNWALASFMVAEGLPGALVVEGTVNDLLFSSL